jgi:hypothetical protein
LLTAALLTPRSRAVALRLAWRAKVLKKAISEDAALDAACGAAVGLSGIFILNLKLIMR